MGRARTVGETRPPPKFHVLSAWSPSRYPGPSVEERGFGPEPVPPSVPRPRAEGEKRAAPSEARGRTTPPSPLPVQSPAISNDGRPYNLNSLLGRVWSIPETTAPGASARSGSPAVAEPSPTSRSAMPSRFTSNGPTPTAPSKSAPVRPPSGAQPRWARAWICPECRLTNPPWSHACTACRAAAPS